MKQANAQKDTFYFEYLHNLKRTLPGIPPVFAIGHIQQKTHIVDRIWPVGDVSLSFITEGNGF
ncbi:MAG: hypothetical protein GF401_15415 [Chitinivibrionales bacterium]|nr:hypothetical protein [Chitinivibrionales bacterium]